MIDTKTYRFHDLDEMVDVVTDFGGIAEVAPLFMLPQMNMYTVELKNKFALYRQSDQEFYGFATDKYVLAQHFEVANAARQAIQSDYPDLFVEGFVKFHGSKMRINFTFPEYVIDDETTGKGIEVGAFLNHSIDGKSGLNGGARFYRVICTNGMMLKSSIPEAEFSIKHLGEFKKNLKSTIGVLTNAVGIHERITRLVESAIEDQYTHFTESELHATLSGILGSKRLASRIVDIAKTNPAQFTRYDLYKDITDYVEHNSKSLPISEKYDRIAEKLLIGDIPVVVPEITA